MMAEKFLPASEDNLDWAMTEDDYEERKKNKEQGESLVRRNLFSNQKEKAMIEKMDGVESIKEVLLNPSSAEKHHEGIEKPVSGLGKGRESEKVGEDVRIVNEESENQSRRLIERGQTRDLGSSGTEVGNAKALRTENVEEMTEIPSKQTQEVNVTELARKMADQRMGLIRDSQFGLTVILDFGKANAPRNFEVIFDELEKVVPQGIVGAGFLPVPFYMAVTMKDEKSMRQILAKENITIDGKVASPRAAAQKVISGRIHWVFSQLPMSALEEFFKPYGEVLQMRDALFEHKNGSIYTKHIREFRLRLNRGISVDDIPDELVWEDLKGLIMINGREPMCLKCRKRGHLRFDCKTIICYRCRQEGHIAADCTKLRTYAERVSEGSKDILRKTGPVILERQSEKEKLCPVKMTTLGKFIKGSEETARKEKNDNEVEQRNVREVVAEVHHEDTEEGEECRMPKLVEQNKGGNEISQWTKVKSIKRGDKGKERIGDQDKEIQSMCRMEGGENYVTPVPLAGNNGGKLLNKRSESNAHLSESQEVKRQRSQVEKSKIMKRAKQFKDRKIEEEKSRERRNAAGIEELYQEKQKQGKERNFNIRDFTDVGVEVEKISSSSCSEEDDRRKEDSLSSGGKTPIVLSNESDESEEGEEKQKGNENELHDEGSNVSMNCSDDTSCERTEFPQCEETVSSIDENDDPGGISSDISNDGVT